MATIIQRKKLPAIFKDEKANTVAGGNFASGAWRIRDLNIHNGATDFASLSGNVITLEPGTYIIKANAPAFNVDQHQTRLYNITDTAVIDYGTNGHAGGISGSSSHLDALLTITVSTQIRLEHQCNTTNASGFGVPCAWGNVEVYSVVVIDKIA